MSETFSCEILEDKMVARYEDGSPTERITPLLAKMHIGHEDVARARRALEEK